MATLTGLALLAAVLMPHVSNCSFKQSTETNGVSSFKKLRASTEIDEQNHSNQKDKTNHDEPKRASASGQDNHKSNYSPYKDPRAAIEINKSIPLRHHRSSTPDFNIKSDRFTQSNRPNAVESTASNYSVTQENWNTAGLRENKRTRNEISRRPYYLDARNIRAKEFSNTDYSNNSSFSRLSDVQYGNLEREFAKENGKGESNLQTNMKSRISKRSVKFVKKPKVITHEDRAKVLMEHNRIRANVKDPTAADMIYMVYSFKLEEMALLWAKECNAEVEFDETVHPALTSLEFDEGKLGHNSGTTDDYYNWNSVIKSWTRGRSQYTYMTSQCSVEETCRQYVTMIWAETVYLGCAVFLCPVYLNGETQDENLYNYVCFYAPSGNTEWTDPHGSHLQPYTRGPPATGCPHHHSYVWNNFCRTEPPCKDVRECVYPPNITTCLCDQIAYFSGQKSLVFWNSLDVGVILLIVTYSSISTYD